MAGQAGPCQHLPTPASRHQPPPAVTSPRQHPPAIANNRQPLPAPGQLWLLPQPGQQCVSAGSKSLFAEADLYSSPKPCLKI